VRRLEALAHRRPGAQARLWDVRGRLPRGKTEAQLMKKNAIRQYHPGANRIIINLSDLTKRT
jgi:hypothetical protein